MFLSQSQAYVMLRGVSKLPYKHEHGLTLDIWRDKEPRGIIWDIKCHDQGSNIAIRAIYAAFARKNVNY